MAVVAVLLVASSRLELRWKMMGASALFIPVLSTMLELWESPLGFVQMVVLSLLEELLVEEGETLCQRVRVSIEGEVVLINVHSRVWVGVSHLVFHDGDRFCAQSRVKMRLDTGHPWANLPFHGVGDDITFVELARELMSRLEEDGAPLPYVFVWGFNLTLDRSPIRPRRGRFFTSTLAMAASRWTATRAETSVVEQLRALFHPHRKLV